MHRKVRASVLVLCAISAFAPTWYASASTQADLSWKPVYDKGMVAYEKSDYKAAEAALLQASSILKLRGDTLDLASCYYWLGTIYSEQKRVAEAEPMLKLALSVQQKLLGDKDNALAPVLEDLGIIYMNEGHFAQAESLLKRAFDIKTTRFGKNDSKVSTITFYLARVYYKLGKYDQSEPLFKSVIALDEKSGESPQIRASNIESLGRLYYKQGLYAEAERLFKSAAALKEKISTQDASFAFSLNYLADLYATQGRIAEAEPLYERALAIAEKTLNPADPMIGTYMNNTAEIYVQQKKFKEAEDLYKKAIAVIEKSGKENEMLASPLGNLAEFYNEQKRFAEAKPLFERALALTQASYGANSAEIAEILHNQAVMCENQKDYLGAEQLYQKSLNVLGKQRNTPGIAVDLNNLATLYQVQERFADAEPVFKRARAVDLRFFGERHNANFVELQAEKEQLTLAKFCLQRLKSQRNIFAPDTSLFAALPDFDASQEEWRRKVELLKAELATAVNEHLDNTANYADEMEIFAFCTSMADPDALIVPDLLKALSIKEKLLGKDDLSTIEARLHFGLYFQSLGGFAFKVADVCQEELFAQAKSLMNSTAQTDDGAGTMKPLAKLNDPAKDVITEISADLVCLSYIYAGMNVRDSDAKETVDKAVLVLDLLKSPIDKVDPLLRVSMLYELMGEYGPARLALTRAQQFCQASKDDSRRFTVQLALARLALMQSDYESAAECAQVALEIGRLQFGENAAQLLSCYELLGQSEAGRGRIPAAIDYTRAAMNASLAVRATDASQAAIQTQLGSLLAEAQKWSESEQILKQAIAVNQGVTDSSQRIQSARTYAALGSLFARQNLNQQAADNYAKAVDIFRKYLNKELVPAYIRALNGSAIALAALGDKDTARTRVFTSADTIKQYINHVFSQLSFGEQCAFVKLADEESGALFSICKDDKSSMEKAYAYAAGWKGLLVESLRLQSELIQNSKKNPGLVSTINDLNTKRRLLAGASQRSSDESKSMAKQLEHEVEGLEQRLQREGGLSMHDSLPLVEHGTSFISDQLKPDEVFVDVIQVRKPDGDHSALGAAIISKSGFRYIDLGDEDSIAHLINNWRSSVTGESISESGSQENANASDKNKIGRSSRDVQVEDGDTGKPVGAADYADATGKLRTAVWTKITSSLPPTVSKIYLCSEGSLARMPWNAIADDGIFVSEVDSPSEFVLLQHRAKENSSNKKVLVAGNIAFNDPLKRVADLDGTKIEIEEIEQLAKDHQLTVFALERENATKAAVTKALANVSFAHFATHGFARSYGRDPGRGRAANITIGASSRTFARNPLLDTGLFFAFPKGASGDSVQEEPGILTASEIVGLDLNSCDLVSLSACQTGLGRELGGQGVVGLRSAIIAAGARSVLMSLWKVDDEATQELMHQFYKNLWAGGKNKAEALRLAQQCIRSDKRHPDWAKPRYWAAWSIVGQSW